MTTEQSKIVRAYLAGIDLKELELATRLPAIIECVSQSYYVKRWAANRASALCRRDPRGIISEGELNLVVDYVMGQFDEMRHSNQTARL